ncbi:MAG: MgtC/SapB family protein [Vicinamibacterales bacterium]
MEPVFLTFDVSTVLARLLAALLAGAVLGLDREVHRKPAGLRTLMLVSLASGFLTMLGTSVQDPVSDPLRVVQAVVTGVGFLGAGVILRREDRSSVEGLTTAASIWVAAALGVGFGLGAFRLSSVALALTAAILMAARPLERRLHRTRGERTDRRRPPGADGRTPSAPRAPGQEQAPRGPDAAGRQAVPDSRA